MKAGPLKKAVSLLNRAASRNSTRPILEGIHVSPFGLRATDLDVDLTFEMETGVDTAIVVDAALLRRALKPFKAKDEVELTATDSALAITYGAGAVSVPSVADVEEFPYQLPAGGVSDSDVAILVDDVALVRALKRVSIAAASDATRFQMNSVLFSRKDGVLNLVSTDGKRMAIERLDTQGGDLEAIVPLAAVEILVRVINRTEHVLSDAKSLKIDGDRLYLTSPGVRFEARLVEGKFPEWTRAIPDAPNETFVLPVDETLTAIEIARTATTKETMGVEFDFALGEMKLTGKGNGEESSAAVDVEGSGEETICFNPDYVRDVLKSVGETSIMVRLTNRKTAALFVSGSFRCIIMPLVTES